MSLRHLIETFDGRLTKADRRLISILLSNPSESTYFRAFDLAERAGVHATTAVRLAQKLGFSGYSELRSQLRDDVQNDPPPAERVRKRLDKISDDGILFSLIESEIQALRSIPDHIKQDQMAQAADALCRAGQMVIFGRGHSSSLADLFARRLTRSGYRARALHHFDWETAETVMSLAAGDVLVAFAFRRFPARLPGALSYCEQNGITSIVISDLIGPVLRPQPDILLAAPRGPEGESQSLSVPMTICNALILEVSRRDGGRSMQSLNRLADVTSTLATLAGIERNA